MVIFGINTTSAISKLLYVISRAVRRVKYETVLKYHEWYCSCLSSLHCLSSPRWINRYWRHIAGMGGEVVTLRWTIWTNIPLRGEYAACCKNLVTAPGEWVLSGTAEPWGGWKKKGFSPPPPTSPYIKQKDLNVEVLLSLPSPPLGKLFRLPYSLARFWLYPVQIKCTLFVYLCSYLSSGAVRHVSRIPYLILHWRFAFSDPQAIFDRKQSLIPYLF